MPPTLPPQPPFDLASATSRVRAAEDAWNSRDPVRVARAYTADSRWRNRDTFLAGRAEITAFLAAKWARERDYRLVKALWAVTGNRVAVRFAYEWYDAAGQWWRSHGNENWEFAADGLMARRIASINDIAITAADRLFHWPRDGRGDRRPDAHPGLEELGL